MVALARFWVSFLTSACQVNTYVMLLGTIGNMVFKNNSIYKDHSLQGKRALPFQSDGCGPQILR